MTYSWTNRDLIKTKRDLIMMKEVIPQSEKSYFELVLKTLNELIDDFSTNSSNEAMSYNERLANIEKELKQYSYFYGLVDNFADQIYCFNSQLNRIEAIFKPFLGDKENYCMISGATLSDAKALSLVGSFYTSLDDELASIFCELFKDKQRSIRFVEQLDGYNNANSFYVDYVKRYFIQMIKSDYVDKLYVLVHEFGHVLSYVMNPKAYLMADDYMYDEVAAVFPELLSYHLNLGNFDSVQVDFEKYSSLITVYNYANALMLHESYVNIWIGQKRNANKKFFKIVRKDLGENIHYLDDGLDTYIYTCGQYIIAYLVGIELLHIYRSNPKKALEIYKNVLRLPYTESVQDYINSELVLGSSLKEETSLLLDEFEKKLMKVGAFHV